MAGDAQTGPQQGSFTNARDQRLVTVLYAPPPGVPVVGVLARLHGLGDYSGRYETGNRWFAQHGFAVWMFDAHGHGLSEPSDDDQRFAVASFSHLVDDAEQFLTEVVRPWHAASCSDAPLFYGGTSMGALTMLHVVGGARVAAPDGLVLSSTAAGIVRTALMRMQEPVAGLLNLLFPTSKLVPALQPERLLSSQELIDEVYKDKMLNLENVRVCTAVAMLEGTDSLAGKLPSISCPVVMLHGACDVTCGPDIAKKALDCMGSKDKTWVLVGDAKHELELDLWKDDWFAYVLEWMNRQVKKRPQLHGKAQSGVSVKRDRVTYMHEINL